MTTLEYLEKVDDTLAHWEDYFHGQEGTDVTEARANLDKVRKQLLIQRLSKSVNCEHIRGSIIERNNEWLIECRKCRELY